MPSTLCLVMIVKNEEAVIARCLASVLPFVSHWVICDTGSTDRTIDIIRNTLRDIPGELYQDPWRDFSYNRNLGLERAKGKADYHLLLDADMVLHCWADSLPALSADAYVLRFTGNYDYAVIRVISDRLEWRYKGVTHECIECSVPFAPEPIPELSVTHLEDGSSRSEKYQRDICLLEQAVAEDPQEARSVFYLAQSYRDAGRLSESLDWYEKRVGMGGWEEEIWYSLYQIGRIQALLDCEWRVVLNSYLQAYNYRPSRLEPVFWIARFYREHGQFPLGFHFARLITEVPYPSDLLFIERDVYEYLLPIEYGLCCFGTRRVTESDRVLGQILGKASVPQELRQWVINFQANNP